MTTAVPSPDLLKLARQYKGKLGVYVDAEYCERDLSTFYRKVWNLMDPLPYKHGWHVDCLSDHLMAVSDGQIKRLLINVPFRTGKSFLVSVAWPAWTWAQHKRGPRMGPQVRFMCLSYGLDLALEAATHHRRLIESDWYKDRWGDIVKLAKDREAVANFETTAMGRRVSLGFDGGTIGRGGEIKIIDDPHKVKEAESEEVRLGVLRTYDEALASRFTDPEMSAEVVIMQRLHTGDLSGHIIEKHYNNFCHVCYDDQTELLTKRGWTLFADVTDDDQVMAVTPKTLEGEWQRPTARQRIAYKGEMIHYKSTAIDLMVTPDHRMIYKDFNDWCDEDPRPTRPYLGKRGNWRTRPACELPTDFYIPAAINWERPTSSVLFGGLQWEPDNFADFMGWYLSEGSTSRKGHVCLVQNPGEKADEIDAMLAASPLYSTRSIRRDRGMIAWYLSAVPVRERGDAIKYNDAARQAFRSAMSALGHSHTKFVPREVLDLPRAALRRFIVAFVKGDGCAAGRNGRGLSMASRSERLIDGLQECAAKAGWASTKKMYMTSQNFSRGKPSTERMLPMHFLYIRSANNLGADRKWYAAVVSRHISRAQYDGEVFCVSVPATALLVRRNGRVAVSGNCLPMEYDPLRHCHTVLGFDDPRGMHKVPDPSQPGKFKHELLPGIYTDVNGDKRLLPGSPMARAEGKLMWPEQFSRQTIDGLKTSLGPYAAAGQLNQFPTPRGGGVIREEWWKKWPSDDHPEYRFVLVSVDTASTEKEENDESGIVVLGVFSGDGGLPQIMLAGAWEGRLEISRLVDKIATMARQRAADIVLIEGKANGIDVANEIRRLHGKRDWMTETFDPKGDKMARLLSIQPVFSGEYRVVNPEEPAEQHRRDWVDGAVWAPDKDWAQMAIDRVSAFPKGRNKAIVDAVSQGIKYLRDRGYALTREEHEDEVAEEERFRPAPKPRYDV